MKRWVVTGSLLAMAGLAMTLFSIRIVTQVDALLHPIRTTPVRPLPPHALASAQDVAFQTSDGLTIRGWFLPGRSRAAVILAPGHGADRAQMIPEATLLARHGFAVLLFDWRAHGESDGALSTRGDQERRDLEGAIDFLAARQDVSAGSIGALGFSRGASVLIEVAAQDERVRACIVEAASTNLAESLMSEVSGPQILSRWPAIWAARKAGIDVDGFRPEASIARLSPRPLLIIHGTRDDAAPVELALRLHAAAKDPKALWLIDGAGHGGYSEWAPAAYEQRLVEFFDAALLSAPRSGAARADRFASVQNLRRVRGDP